MLSEQQFHRLQRLLDGGHCAEDAGDLEEAKRLFEACIAMDDGDTPVTEEEHDIYRPLFFAYLHRATDFRDEHNDQMAIQLAERALAGQEHKKHALFVIGHCYEHSNRLEEAEAAFREGLAGASETDERVRFYVFLFGVVCRDKARLDEAKDLLEKALELDPDYEEAHYNLGVVLFHEGDLESAQPRLERALAIDPEYASAHYMLGKLHLRNIHLGNDPQWENDEAKTSEYHLTRSMELDPEHLESRLQLIDLYWTLARYRKAEEHCRYVVQMFPKSSVAHWVCGDFFACTDRGRQKAESLLKKAIELDDEDDGAYYMYGKALLRWERWSEARYMLERAHQLGHDSALALLKADTSPG